MRARPTVAPATAWHFPDPLVSRLDNGLTLWSYRLPGQHVITANLVFDLPLTAEPAGLEGIATLAALGLDEGTENHPGETYSAALESQGAQYSGWASLSASTASLELPGQWFEPGLRLFAEAVQTPAYADEAVERLKSQRLADLDQTRSNPRRLAGWLLRGTVLDPAQRAGRPLAGSRANVAAIQPEDVRRFQAERHTPDRATLVVAGDIDPQTVASAVTRIWGDWRGSGTAPADHQPPLPGRPSRRLIDRPDAVQADIRLGWCGLDRSDRLWPAFKVAAAIMGDGFSSRLNQVLREDRGWTYDVSLAVRGFRLGGLVILGTSTKTETAAAALAEAERITAGDAPAFSARETADAIGWLTGVAPLSFSTAAAVADQAAGMVGLGFGPGQTDQSLRAIAQVTPDEATAAWRAVISRQSPSLVVVGPGDRLAEPLGLDPEPRPEL
ncbi:MAG: insulinase family protein [Propionibacteriaceae bacterium]|jgi:predicted Zn-dependent peptidase|nr:insulinase family protein [Propionibacteriaceae bacterium]